MMSRAGEPRLADALPDRIDCPLDIAVARTTDAGQELAVVDIVVLQ
jgi:hypothetical protein